MPPPSNPILKQYVLQVLNDPVTRQINFVMGGYEFRTRLYEAVRSAVNNEGIRVYSLPGSWNATASYTVAT